MAETNGTVMAKILASPTQLAEANEMYGKVRCFNEFVTLSNPAAGEDDGDTINVGRIPKGARILYGILQVSVTMGAAATLAIGLRPVDGSAVLDTASLRLAAVKTTLVPEVFGKVSTDTDGRGVGEKLSTDHDVIITIATADLPAVGKILTQIFYAVE